MRVSRNRLDWIDKTRVDKYVNRTFHYLLHQKIGQIVFKSCRIDESSFIKIISCPWQNLRYVCIASNALTNRGMQSLTSANLSQLRRLNLENNLIGDEGMNFLVIYGEGCWDLLKTMNLTNNLLTSRALDSLKHCTFSNLINLHLSCNKIGNSGIAQLVRIELLNLQILELESNFLTDSSMKVLLKGNWSRIAELNISMNHLGDDSAVCLWRIPSSKFAYLRYFEIDLYRYASDSTKQVSLGGIKQFSRRSKDSYFIFQLNSADEVRQREPNRTFIMNKKLTDIIESNFDQ